MCILSHISTTRTYFGTFLREEPAHCRLLHTYHAMLASIVSLAPHAPNLSFHSLSQVKSDNLVSFLGTAVLSNKPRLIIVSPKPHPQPHHLLVAMKYRHFIAFGFVSTAKGLNDAVARHLKVPVNEEASIVFKESSQNAAGRSPVMLITTVHLCVCECVCV